MDIDFNEVARLNRVWRNMLSRCENPDNKQYADYGGRGVYVAEDWHDFHTFATWALMNGSSSELQLDREDNDGPYTPDNCRFVTRQVNARNKRNTVHVTAFGETKPLQDWGEDPRCLVHVSTLGRRIARFGWDPEEAMTVKFRRDRQSSVCSQGHQMTEDNTYRRSGSDFRVCKTCAKERARAAYWKNKEKRPADLQQPTIYQEH